MRRSPGLPERSDAEGNSRCECDGHWYKLPVLTSLASKEPVPAPGRPHSHLHTLGQQSLSPSACPPTPFLGMR